jgi:hypothetical protein
LPYTWKFYYAFLRLTYILLSKPYRCADRTDSNAKSTASMLATYCLFSVLLTPTSFLAFGQLGTYDDGGPCDSCLNNLYNICGGTDSSGFATCLCTGASDQLIPCEATCAMESSFYLAAIVSDWTGFCAVYGPEAQSQPARYVRVRPIVSRLPIM